MSVAKKKVEKKSEAVVDTAATAREIERLNQRIDNMMERVVWLEDNFMASKQAIPVSEGKRWNIVRLFGGGK